MADPVDNERELTGGDALRFARECRMEEATRGLFYVGVGDLIRFARLLRAGWRPAGVDGTQREALTCEASKLALQWEHRARSQFLSAERYEVDSMERRALEHGARCYLNAANELRDATGRRSAAVPVGMAASDEPWLTLPDGRSFTLAQLHGIREYSSWFRSTDCVSASPT